MKRGYWILKNKKPIHTEDIHIWGRFFEDINNRRVAMDILPNGKKVSTVFLGIDHNFGEGDPHLFETMVFDKDSKDEEVERCSTWEQAEEMHRRMVDKYK